MIDRFRAATALDRYRIDTVPLYHRPCLDGDAELVEMAQLMAYGGGRGWRCILCGTSWQLRTFALFTGAELADRFVVRARESDDTVTLVWRTEGKVRFTRALAPSEIARDGDAPFSAECP